ncbi:hypothetical protein N2152v2_010363 [Parachlorella kessleri]
MVSFYKSTVEKHVSCTHFERVVRYEVTHKFVRPAECPIEATRVSSLSNFTVGGQQVSPATTTLVLKHPEALTGLEGSLQGTLAADTCPSTAAELTQQLEGAIFQTTQELGGLTLYPSSIQANALAGSLVDLQQISFNVSTAPLEPPSAGSAGGQYSSEVEASISTGYALVTSLLSPLPETQSLEGLTASNATSVYASVTPEGLARVELRGLFLTFPSVYVGSFMGQPITGEVDYELQGSIVMEAALGCTEDCGRHGKCAAANGTTAASCVCECGWAGAACDVPSGFCPRFSSEESLATCPVNPTLSPSPSPSPATPSAPCAAVGNTGYPYTLESQYKAYTCDLEGTGLNDVIENNSFYFSCNTTAPSVVSSPAGQYCEVNFALKDRGSNPIDCKAYQCSFRANSTRVDCQTTHCKCQTACPDVQGILDSAEGKPVWVDCDPATGDCTIEIQDFFVTFVAPCSPAECLVPGYLMDEGTYTVSTDKDYNPVIAAVPLMGLVAVAAFLSTYLITHRAYWAAGSKGWAPVARTITSTATSLSAAAAAPVGEGAAPAVVGSSAGGAAVAGTGGSRGVVPLQAGETVDELRFDHLSCTVPLSSGWFGSLPFLRKRRHSSRHQNIGEAAAMAGQEASCREILRDVSGVARRGELVGVLGPSGSGKTTLLALVTGSSEDVGREARAEGAVLLDGAPLNSALRRKVAFVPQDDTLLPTLTVAECLTYSALLRLPTSLTPEQVQAQAQVRRVVEELGLQHVAGSRVGGLTGSRGISGGERRRVTIGMELVTDPAVLVLDEPTSGLDSYTALLLMKTLKQVASAGRIVMLSFHQPSPSMFSLLDRAYLLARGSCVFSGPPAAADAHFAAHGLPCPAGSAVAEHMLQVVSDPPQLSHLLLSVNGGKPKLGQQQQQQLTAVGVPANGGLPSAGDAASPSTWPHDLSERDSLRAEQDSLPVEQQVHHGTMAGWQHEDAVGAAAATSSRGTTDSSGGLDKELGLENGLAPTGAASTQVASLRGRTGGRLSRELAVVFWRTLVDILRNPSLLILHWAMAVGMGVLMGAIFYNVGLDISGAQNRAGGLFFALAFFAFTSLTTTDLLTAERRLVVREVRGGYYHAYSYLLSKAVLDALLLRVIPVFLYSAPFYPMMGLQSGSTQVALFLMLLATFAVAVGALSLAVTVGKFAPRRIVQALARRVAGVCFQIGSGCSTAGKASLVMNLILLISLLVGGFFVNVASIPGWIRWLHYLSLFFYAYASLITNEVANLSMDFVLEGYAAVSNVKGLAFLDIIGIDASKITTYIIVLDCLYVACLLLAFVLLYLRLPRPQLLRRRRQGAAQVKS